MILIKSKNAYILGRRGVPFCSDCTAAQSQVGSTAAQSQVGAEGVPFCSGDQVGRETRFTKSLTINSSCLVPHTIPLVTFYLGLAC